MSETLLLFVILAIVLLLLVLGFISKTYLRNETPQAGEGAPNVQGGRRRLIGENRGVRQRGHHREEPQHNEDDDGPSDPLDIQLPEGKVGAKKLAKLQAKAERKAAREVEERDRQERKKRQELEDAERKDAEEKERAEEKRKEEELKRIQEEKERKEHEEYLKLKEAFSIESEGFEEEVVEGDNALQNFVNYIKKNKVVVIEDVAAQFRLKTQQAIDRIQQLQTDGILSGVIDDRGKFIYISREELSAVAKFVKQRGRVTISELVDNSNMLIDLTPTLSV